MTRRDDIRAEVLRTIERELGTLSGTTSEFREEYELRGKIDGRSFRVKVTSYPRGENPETFEGDELWQVELFGDEGEALRRPTNLESSLDDALESINWNQIRREFRGD